MLRIRSAHHAGTRAASRRPGAARPRAGLGAALDVTAGQARLALPPGRWVVALGEVVGVLRSGHPGDLPVWRGRPSALTATTAR